MPMSISRHHVRVNGRGVHYRRTGSGPPVLLLHESPRSSVALLPLLMGAPPGVTAMALDTPGNGLSDPLPWDEPSADDYADALANTMDALGIPRAVVYGTHTGAAFGMALAQRHPQRVAALVLDGIGAFDAAERAQLLDSYLPRFEPRADGSHLTWLWSRVRDQALFFPWNRRGFGARLWRDDPVPPPAALQAVAMDLLMAGDAYRAPYSAAFRFQPAAVLPTLAVPTRVAARADDMLLPHLERLPPLPAPLSVHRLPPRGPAWQAQVWAWLREGCSGLDDAPPALDAALPSDGLGSTLLGLAGQRLHLRGVIGGPGRPQVWLPPSPGGARALDPTLCRATHHGPALAIDLPGHGDSDAFAADPEATLDALHIALAPLAPLTLHGLGLGDAVARALAQAHPTHYAASTASTAGPLNAPAEGFAPRADGGHLAAAWLHARDEAILGPWWWRRTGDHFGMGDDLPVATIHAAAVEALKEAPQAAEQRKAWRQRVARRH